ncbi:MAG: phospholipase D-like domain-containing protein [Pseudomonadota bacterium]
MPLVLKRTLSFLVVMLLTFLFLSSATVAYEAELFKVYFSPNGNCEKAIIEEIRKAKICIHIAIFNFTNGRIARELVKVSKKGIDIKVIMDMESSLNHYSKGRFLEKKGISVKYRKGVNRNKVGDETGLMHNKFVIIDRKVVITGSYNWTASAEKWNYENLLVIPSKKAAKLFEKEFNSLWIKN